MTYAAFDSIAQMFITIFGTPAMIGIIVLGFFVLGLVILRAHAWVMLAILIPMVLVFATAGGLIQVSRTFIIVLLFIAALVLAGVLMSFQR